MQPDPAEALGGHCHVQEGQRRKQAKEDALEGEPRIMNAFFKIQYFPLFYQIQDYYATILLMRKQQLERMKLQMEKAEGKTPASSAKSKEERAQAATSQTAEEKIAKGSGGAEEEESSKKKAKKKKKKKDKKSEKSDS